MTLEQFIATKRELPVGAPDMPRHVLDLIEDDDMVSSVMLYGDAFWIAKWNDGRFWLILERDEYVSHDVAELEPKLYEWCKSEGI